MRVFFLAGAVAKAKVVRSWNEISKRCEASVCQTVALLARYEKISVANASHRVRPDIERVSFSFLFSRIDKRVGLSRPDRLTVSLSIRII